MESIMQRSKAVPVLIQLSFSVALSVVGPGAWAEEPMSSGKIIQDVRVLSPEWICVVVDPTAETLARREEMFGVDFAKDLDDYRNQRGNSSWFFEKSATYRTMMAMKAYQYPLFVRMQAASFWTVNGAAPAEVSVWAHSVDAFPAVSADESPTREVYSPISRLAHMVYLKLNQPLRSGEALEVTSGDGRRFSLAYDDAQTVSWSIKVNQSAYDVKAVEKKAYVGMWIPGLGAADFSGLEGRTFALRRVEDGRVAGEPVFEGTIKLRRLAADQEVRRDGGANLTGEDVYELDFSGMKEAGTFVIQIPGLGRSWPFKVTPDGYGEAFYTLMKGLFIQRSGTALSKPHTGWERPSCFLETRPGQYVAESESWYLQRYRTEEQPARFGFRDASGKQVPLSAFTLIGNSDPEAAPIPGLWGGWHDAADFDRRYHHYNVVWDLLALADVRAGQFPDAQLNMPESGNGVPDLLDEAEWGLEVWRRSQRPDGAVSSWIEQESHPHSGNDLGSAFSEGDKKMPFFASIPDRTGTFAYAASAAWLGRLLRPYAPERSREWIASAERAFAWAESGESVMRDLRFTIERPMRDRGLQGQTIRFDEDPEIGTEDRAFTQSALAAANLYLATRNPRYVESWKKSGFVDSLSLHAHRVNPSQLVSVLKEAGLPAEDVATIQNEILKQADSILDAQAAHPYRMYWLAPEAGWYHAMAWGNIHNKTRSLSIAYLITGEERHRTALQHAANFFLGTNPQGTSMITGIGSVFPVVLQHIHSMNDGIAEPTPGIAPFWLTYGVNLTPFYVADNGHPSVNAFYEPTAMAFIPEQLGRTEIQRDLDAAEKTGNWVRENSAAIREAVWKNYPVLRRRAIHPTHVVDQNEFTVNETISPLALMFGALTADGWMPSQEQLKREPIRSMDQLPYYPMP
jgi:hypothetical protein